MYQALPKWISCLGKVSSTWQSKISMFRAIHTSATWPDSQTNYIVSQPPWAAPPQSTPCSFYTTLKPLTYLSLGPSLRLAPPAVPGNEFILIHPYSWEAHESASGSVDLLPWLQLDSTLEEFS